jgi:type II secretory pathway pseudopilin PulG
MRRRQGFTIPELLVAMALIMFIMAILAEAFKAGLDSFRQLKAVGDLQEKLRSATSALRTDLESYHFGDARRPGDPSIFHTLTSPPPYNTPPYREQSGFFAIYGFPSPTTYPPAGTDGTLTSVEMPNPLTYPATWAPLGNPYPSLHFTVLNAGHMDPERQSYFTARVPPASAAAPLNYLALRPPQDYWDVTQDSYHNQVSEVAYFVRPNGRFAGTQQLFALYRRQLVLVSDSATSGPSESSNLNSPTNTSPPRIPYHSALDPVPYASATQGLFAGMSSHRDLRPPPPAGNNNFLYFNGPQELGFNGTGPLSNGAVYPALNPNVTIGMLNRGLWINPARFDFPVSPPGGPYYPNTPDYPILGVTPPFANYDRYEDLRPLLIPGPQDMLPGDDILLNDVVVFNVRVLLNWSPSAPPGYSNFDFTDLPPVPLTPPTGTALPIYDTTAPYGTVGATPGVPTYTVGGTSYTYQLRAVQITLRVWDVKTETTRQVTVVENMTPN